MPPVFVLTTRGLEAITAQEITALTDVDIQDVSYRRITALCDHPVQLLQLRTADDAFLSLDHWTDIGHTRDMLAVFCERATQLNFRSALKTLRTLRPLPETPMFAVTASFVGKRNFSSEEIKTAVADGITQSTGWAYSADDRSASLNIRVFIEHHHAYIGLRLSDHPLHERDDRAVERVGALKPSIAAALVQLAEIKNTETLLDLCCGSGTILIEAARMGIKVLGGDLDVQAVQTARKNMRAAGQHFRVDVWDARSLPVSTESVDAVVSNLPWGRQIVVDETLASVYQDILLESERVLKAGGKAIFLTTSPQLLQGSALRMVDQKEISVFGQNASVCLFEKMSSV